MTYLPPNHLLTSVLLLGVALVLPACSDADAPAPAGTTPAEVQFADVSNTSGVVAQQQDLIIVTVDTLRADRLPFYGGKRATGGDSQQPWSLAWLAENGTVLDEVYAQVGITLPSLCSLWTGMAPLQHGVLENRGLLTEDTYIMELADAGWSTIGVVCSGILRRGTGLERGFDAYTALSLRAEQRVVTQLIRETITPITEKKPLLIWAHFVAPHSPYEAVEPFFGQFATKTEPRGSNDTIYAAELANDNLEPWLGDHLRALYDEELLATNDYVQSLLRGLDQNYRDQGRGGLLENAVVVFTADHGEELGDHNGFFMHAKSLYPGVTRVPAIVLGADWPQQRDQRLLGLQHLLPWVIYGQLPEQRYVVSTLKDRRFAIRDERWTMIHNPLGSGTGPGGPPVGSSFPYPSVALYDRRADPLEFVDVAAKYPEETVRLLDALREWFDALPIAGEEEFNSVVDDHILSELGYATSEAPGEPPTPLPWTGQQWLDR